MMIDTSYMQYQLVSYHFDRLFWSSAVIGALLLAVLVFLTHKFLNSKKLWIELSLFLIEASVLSLVLVSLVIKPRIIEAKINDFEVVEVEGNLVMLSFVTDQPVLVNLVQNDGFLTFKQIMPTNTFQPQNRHNFLVDIKKKETKLIFEINGQKYYLKWRPLILKY